LFHNYFKHLGAQYRGVYVDVGSNHPTELSNTAFFDKCLGWRGVCIEPQPGALHSLHYDCMFVNHYWCVRACVCDSHVGIIYARVSLTRITRLCGWHTSHPQLQVPTSLCLA
jgi:hypothetical protein